MNVNSGEILSLVSLPNFDINKRINLKDKKYINKITKGVYELGSIFKTFTIALALENNIVKPKTELNDISQNVKCSNHVISDLKKKISKKFISSRYIDKIIKCWNITYCQKNR